MKKILLVSVLISFLAVLLVPVVTSAQVAPTTCDLKRDLTDIDKACVNDKPVSIEDYGMCCLINTLYNITDWIFVFLAALAGLFVIIGAMQILTAAGNPESVAKGRNYILYAAIGLAVGFLAKAIPGIVKLIVGT